MNELKVRNWPAIYEPAGDGQDGRYIFISYAHEDADIVYQDLKVLSDSGARIWYDKGMHMGQDWEERARARILAEDCGGVLFYLSPHSIRSTAVLKELSYVEQHRQTDPDFLYFSVNIGGGTAFQMLNGQDVPEDSFLALVKAFHHRKLYITRAPDPMSRDHLSELLSVFDEARAIREGYAGLLAERLFTVAPYEDGLQITGYGGADDSVEIPAEVSGKKILAVGINAFRGNRAIRRVTVPEGVLRIDDFAFSGCEKLREVYLPNSLRSLGYEAFRDCAALEQLTLFSQLSVIGDYCFYKCHALEELRLLSAVPLEIRFAAFSECHALRSLTLPASTRCLGPYVFNNCISLTGITLPAGLTEVGMCVFNSCVSLRTVTLEQRTPVKNEKLFTRCGNLRQVLVRAELRPAYLSAPEWEGLRDLLAFRLPIPGTPSYRDGVISWAPSEGAAGYVVTIRDEIYRTTATDLHYTLPEGVRQADIRVRATAAEAPFVDSPDTEPITVYSGENVWEIDEGEAGRVLIRYHGFDRRVEIPDGIVQIGPRAFYNNQELESVAIPDSVTDIRDEAFYHCIRLRELRLPEGLRHVGANAFGGIRITELTLPETVETMGEMCFACCNDLRRITLRSARAVMGPNVFYRCISLERAELPAGMREMYRRIFRGCTELEELELPPGLEVIREGAVSYVMRMRQITIPASVTLLEPDVFACSLGLRAIRVEPGGASFFSVDGALVRTADGTLLRYPPDRPERSWTVPAGIRRIGSNAFSDAEMLEEIVLTEAVTEVEKNAFERCPNLKTVRFRGGVERLGAEAFKDCINLSELWLWGDTVPETGDGVFSNTSAALRIRVPDRFYRNYRRIVEWQPYIHMVEPFAGDAET